MSYCNKFLPGLCLVAAALLTFVPRLVYAEDTNGAPLVTNPDADPDNDGLTNQEEANYGTKPNAGGQDTDGDGVLDGQDGWAKDNKIKVARLPESRYAAINLKGLGYAGQWVSGLDDNGNVLHGSDDLNDIYIFDSHTSVATPIPFFAWFLSRNGYASGAAYDSSTGKFQSAYLWDAENGTEITLSAPSFTNVPNKTVDITPYATNGQLTVGTVEFYGDESSDHQYDQWGGQGPLAWPTNGQLLASRNHWRTTYDSHGNETSHVLVEDEPGVNSKYFPHLVNDMGVIVAEKANYQTKFLNGTTASDVEGYVNDIGDGPNGLAVGVRPFPLPLPTGTWDNYGALFYQENNVWQRKDLKIWDATKGIEKTVRAELINKRAEMLKDGLHILRNGIETEIFNDSDLWDVGLIRPSDNPGTYVLNNKGWLAGWVSSNNIFPDDSGFVPILLIPVDLAVDANRDGTVKFAGNFSDANATGKPQDTTSQDKPFRFWCNDDQDSANLEAYTGGDVAPIIVADSVSNSIQAKRDLEDFARLHINIGGLQDAIANGTIQVGLEWRNTTPGPNGVQPSIKVFQAAEPDGGVEYIKNSDKNETWADRQIDGQFKTKLSTTVAANDTSVRFPLWFWDTTNWGLTKFSADHPNRYLLFEAVTEGKGQLVLTFWKGSTPIGEGGGVWLDLKNVRKMYRRGQINQDAPSIPNPWVNDNPPALTWTWDISAGVPEMDPNAEKKTICFVHGWRMSPDDYLAWSDTTFKRLYHMGYKGDFYSFRWPTYHGGNGGNTPIDLFVPGSSTYNPSEYRAWLSGAALASFVNGLPNADNRFLIAHSMGNVVAGAALRNGMSVKRYEMCNAAMAAMAYDPSIVDDNYTTPDTDSDSNTATTYGLKNKFNFPYIPASTTLINFYLPNDSALRTWKANNQIFKPQTFANGQEYAYHSEAAVGDKLRYNLDSVNNYRHVTSVPEAMGYLTRSRSAAAGSKASVGGSVGSSVNMGDGGFGFEETHSAEWNYTIQKTYPFWKAVLQQFQIDVGDH